MLEIVDPTSTSCPLPSGTELPNVTSNVMAVACAEGLVPMRPYKSWWSIASSAPPLDAASLWQRWLNADRRFFSLTLHWSAVLSTRLSVSRVDRSLYTCKRLMKMTA